MTAKQPYFYYDAEYKLTGLDAELMRSISKSQNATIEYFMYEDNYPIWVASQDDPQLKYTYDMSLRIGHKPERDLLDKVFLPEWEELCVAVPKTQHRLMILQLTRPFQLEVWIFCLVLIAKGEKIIECSELNSISSSSGNCVGVGTHSHVWDCGSPRYTRALPADTHCTRAEHLAVRPRSSTRRKLSSLTAAYGRRSQFTCPAHVVEPRGEPAKHDLTAAYLAGRRRPLQAHVAESYQPAIAEHPRGKSHALQEYDTFAPAVYRPEK
ncbi:hypothetical protein pipiens_003071 [Culex pipiens pipiens]|uniref:Uncharacterized protein n=1 Tax=Culex pipiens pipiens TaxID=38569 RepID=A0ABD1D3Z9_CULPP